MSTDEDEKINIFEVMCGPGKDQARFYLEASGWNVEAAVEEFFSSNDNDNDNNATSAARQPAPSAPQERQPERAKGGSSGSRFVSMSAFRSRGESDDDEEEGQAFYVGGSEKGAGQQVLGPPRKKTGEIVRQMFESAREHGAVSPEEDESPGATSSRGLSFTGTGYRLGDSVSAPSEVVVGASRPRERPKPVDRVLKLWNNGFSIDDGPLRSYHDSEEREFLSAVQHGEIPNELLKDAKGGEVNLNMEDHRDEAYAPPPKPKLVPFSGTGHMLGSPAPDVPAPTQTAVGAPSVERVKVDASQPTTRMQVRLENGSRLVVSLNLSHTVADIRNEIMSQRPQYAGMDFVLMTTFPNRELTDDSQTIDSAKLHNAAISMRMK